MGRNCYRLFLLILISIISTPSYPDFFVPTSQGNDQILYEGENPVLKRGSAIYDLSACLTIHKDLITLKLFIKNKYSEPISVVLGDISLFNGNGEEIKINSPAEVVVFKHGRGYGEILNIESSNTNKMITKELMSLDFPEQSNNFNYFRHNLERGNLNKIYEYRRSWNYDLYNSDLSNVSWTSHDIGNFTYYHGGITGSSHSISDFTYYNLDGFNTTSHTIGDFTYYHGDISGSSHQIGSFAYYHLGNMNITKHNIGNFSYFHGDISGSAHKIGDFTYYHFNNMDITRHDIGNFNYYNAYKWPDYRYNYSPTYLPSTYYYPTYPSDYSYLSPGEIVGVAMIGLFAVGLLVAEKSDIVHTFTDAFTQGEIGPEEMRGGKIYYIFKRKDIQYPLTLNIRIGKQETQLFFNKYIGRTNFAKNKSDKITEPSLPKLVPSIRPPRRDVVIEKEVQESIKEESSESIIETDKPKQEQESQPSITTEAVESIEPQETIESFTAGDVIVEKDTKVDEQDMERRKMYRDRKRR